MRNKQTVGNFSKITADELSVLARVIHEANGEDTEKTLLELELIDDLLLLQDSKLLLNNLGRKTEKGFLRKNFKNFSAVLDGRIGKYVEDIKELEKQNKALPFH